MAEDFQRNKQYQYALNSNLVLEADRSIRRGKDEGTGEVESLKGKIGGMRMGDRINREERSELNDRIEKAKAKRTREDEDPSIKKKMKGRKSIKTDFDRANVLNVTEDLDSINYRPKTRESKMAYEEILSFIMHSLGDQPQDILRGAADEILSTLKDDGLRDPQREKLIGKILGNISSDRFNKLVNLGKQITDFDSGENAGDGSENNNKLDEEMGVAVIFDGDEDDDDNDDDDDDNDEDEDGVAETDGTNLLRGEQVDLGDDNTGSQISVHDIDAHWLQRQLSKFYTDTTVTAKLADSVLAVLKLTDERVCENKLVVLLDYDKFDFIKVLLQNRAKIYYCTMLKQAQSDEEREALEKEMVLDSESDGAALLDQLKQKASAESWTKDRMGEFRDKVRREARALRVEQAGEAMETENDVVGGIAATSTRNSSDPVPEKMLDLEGLQFSQGSHLMMNKSCELPEKTRRIQKKGYEEVHVPAIRPVISSSERLKDVADLPEWTHRAFPGINTLNRIQSRMVDAALYGSENILLCAPTGAGKTNVALLCMLNQLGQHMKEDGSFDLDAFKIVYVAPMKALVQECVQSFGKKLAPFGVTVRELSGDQNLTRQQIQETQVIVTTPEKWDIITRKAGDRTYTQLVRLMIIDEIHLLHDERGPVLESLVARTIRQVETTQEMVRLVGLSATLPNFEDVATFLRVNPEKGLFYFDNSFRPVPLQQQYIGITEKKALKRFQLMNEICYEKVLQQAGKNQVLIFTHSRADTVKTAKALRDLAIENDTVSLFVKDNSASREILREESDAAKSPDLKDLLSYGFAVHHAGMVRADRTLVEDLFADKHVQVLVSTATLAWGVNLPCHTVILKGTQMYNPEQGRWAELSPLDVMQMLGRAGRYGLDSEGEGIIMTQHSELQFYLSLMNQQLPIESQFIKKLPDMLNAEIVLGTVMSVREAASWLGYTYLFVRMLRNPSAYGVSQNDVEDDPTLFQRRLDLCHTAATILDKHNLIKYDRKSGLFQVTTLGRVASHYYVGHESINVFNEYLKPSMSDIEIFRLFSLSGEFKNIHVREEEKLELAKLVLRVPIPIKEGVEEPSAKINVLLQAYISRLKLDGFALVADMTYVQQSACRLMRALFEVALKRGWSALACRTLTICKMVERRAWSSQSPLRQFGSIPEVIIKKLEKVSDIAWERYYDLKPQDFGEMVKIPKMGKTLHKYVHMFPKVELSASVLPITRSLLKVFLTITPDFQFDASVHESSLLFWVVVEDVDGEKILHCEPLSIRMQYASQEHYINFTVPIHDPQPPQYFIKVISDRWLHSEAVLPVSFRHLILPQKYPPLTELLDLQPLPVTVLGIDHRQLFSDFKVFNPIQTQVFASLFQSDSNVLLCAPTGSGKTVCAELALMRLFSTKPNAKCVYLAPRDEIVDYVYAQWSGKLAQVLGVAVCRLTGETAADLKLLESGNVILASAVHWDMMSRRWKQRKNVQNIDLYIADELHLIGSTEGPTYEMALSRARYVASQLERTVRIIGLSSSLANAKDIGDWCGVSQQNVFNFPTSVRPVPLEINLQGFDTNHVYSRILAMSKHAYNGLTGLGKNKTALVFVSSRKQAQLSAIDFITFAAAGGTPDRFLNVNPEEIRPVIELVKDAGLAHTLAHGVGFLHPGLSKSDQNRVRGLYRDNVISVLVVPHDLCWSVPSPATLVIVVDTVYYEGREHRYVDYPLTDLMQMVGLASRPMLDTSGKCIVLCHAPKKDYLKRLLHEPLPIESHLGHFLHDHLNAEVVTKTIENKQDAVDLLTWTFYYRRLTQNPNYYNLQGSSHRHISDHLSELVETSITDLEQSKCLAVEDEMDLSALNLGMIASYYYIQYTTIELFASSVTQKTKIKGMMEIISAASEFSLLPIRHNEDEALRKLAIHLPQSLPESSKYDDASTKALILLQLHFSKSKVSTDLITDMHTVLRDSVKLLQALVDVISSQGWLRPALAAMELSQMVVQGLWYTDSPLLQIPHFNAATVERLTAANPPIETVFDVLEMDGDAREQLLQLTTEHMSDVAMFCNTYPNIDVSYDFNADAEVVAGDPVTVIVTLRREVDDEDDDADIGKVVCPRYPFPKVEGWWLVIGDSNSNSLMSIKRVAIARAAKVSILPLLIPVDLAPYDLHLTEPLCTFSLTGQVGIHCTGRSRRLQSHPIAHVRQLPRMRPGVPAEPHCGSGRRRIHACGQLINLRVLTGCSYM